MNYFEILLHTIFKNKLKIFTITYCNKFFLLFFLALPIYGAKNAITFSFLYKTAYKSNGPVFRIIQNFNTINEA